MGLLNSSLLKYIVNLGKGSASTYLMTIELLDDILQCSRTVTLRADAPTSALFDALRIAVHRAPLNGYHVFTAEEAVYSTELLAHPLAKTASVAGLARMFPEFFVAMPETPNWVFHVKLTPGDDLALQVPFRITQAQGLAPFRDVDPCDLFCWIIGDEHSEKIDTLINADPKLPFRLMEEIYFANYGRHSRNLMLMLLPEFITQQSDYLLAMEAASWIDGLEPMSFRELVQMLVDQGWARMDAEVALSILEEANLMEYSPENPWLIQLNSGYSDDPAASIAWIIDLLLCDVLETTHEYELDEPWPNIAISKAIAGRSTSEQLERLPWMAIKGGAIVLKEIHDAYKDEWDEDTDPPQISLPVFFGDYCDDAA